MRPLLWGVGGLLVLEPRSSIPASVAKLSADEVRFDIDCRKPGQSEEAVLQTFFEGTNSASFYYMTIYLFLLIIYYLLLSVRSCLRIKRFTTNFVNKSLHIINGE